MEASVILLALLALFTKHLIIDFPLQMPYQYKNKGTYGHPGGIVHSGLHGIGTAAVFAFLIPIAPAPMMFAFIAGLADAVIHYHVDWAKMNLNKKLGWGPTTHEQFWWLLGVDQFLHAITYIGIAYFAFV